LTFLADRVDRERQDDAELETEAEQLAEEIESLTGAEVPFGG